MRRGAEGEPIQARWPVGYRVMVSHRFVVSEALMAFAEQDSIRAKSEKGCSAHGRGDLDPSSIDERCGASTRTLPPSRTISNRAEAVFVLSPLLFALHPAPEPGDQVRRASRAGAPRFTESTRGGDGARAAPSAAHALRGYRSGWWRCCCARAATAQRADRPRG